MQNGYLTRVGAALKAPSDGMTWTQLAASVVFVLVVVVAWRQVIQLIMREI